MSHRLNEFFAREAAEYLTELDGLFRAGGTPDADAFLRLSTGVRGSLQMAEADNLVVLAEALEGAARAIVGAEVRWTDSFRDLAGGTVAELRTLIASIGRWGALEEERLRTAISRWSDGSATQGDGAADKDAARIVPISDLFYDNAGPHIVRVGGGGSHVAAATGPVGAASVGSGSARPTSAGSDQSTGVQQATDPVPIETLLFSGTSAFREALALRPRIEEAAHSGPSESLDALIAELFDLVELGVGVDHPNEG